MEHAGKQEGMGETHALCGIFTNISGCRLEFISLWLGWHDGIDGIFGN